MSSGGEEAILEDDSAGSYLAEALSMSSVGPDIDKGVGWDLVLYRQCCGVS